jgi:putative SOS response-associated peptidase YedK
MHDRMPVIVPADKYEVWLDPDVRDFGAIKDILKPYDATQMRRYPVSTKMNNSKNEGAESAAPVTLDNAVKPRLFENN